MAVHTEAGVFQRYTGTEHGAGDVTNNAFLYALMSVARGQQTGYDDADADWLLLGYEVTLTADGTFKLSTQDADGTVDDLTDAIPLKAGVPHRVNAAALRVPAGKDLVYTTTGGGDSIVAWTAEARRHGFGTPLSDVP